MSARCRWLICGLSLAAGCDRSARAAGGPPIEWQAGANERTQAPVSPSQIGRPSLGPAGEALSHLRVPDGFRVSVFASGIENARMLAVAEDGSVFVSRQDPGDVMLLTDRDNDGRADGPPVRAANGLDKVNGLALRPGLLFMATPTRVYVSDRLPDGSVSSPRVLADNLPAGGRHPNRTLGIGPDGMLYVSVGSSCNACVEQNPEHATMLRMRLDGSGREVFARGLRNTIGFDWHPTTHALWGMDHGSDDRGNDLPPEELNELNQGGHYGWPHCVAERSVDPLFNEPAPQGTPAQFCGTTRPSTLGFQAHSAPMMFQFYTGAQFPAGYRNDAFVAFRGSWNRSPPSGHKVVRVRFSPDGRPLGFEDFLTGFLSADGNTRYGRPVGLAIARDGSLLVADDTNGNIFRVSHEIGIPHP